MIKPSSQNKFLFAFLGLAAIAAILWCVGHYAGAAISPALTMLIRWAALIAVCGYCVGTALTHCVDLRRDANWRGDRP